MFDDEDQMCVLQLGLVDTTPHDKCVSKANMSGT